MIRLGKPAKELDVFEITKAVRRMCISATIMCRTVGFKPQEGS